MKANYAQRHNERKEEIREAQLFNWCTNAMHPMIQKDFTFADFNRWLKNEVKNAYK